MLAPDLIDLPYPRSATRLFEAIRDLPEPIWLDSGKPRSLRGRFDIISAAPLITLETQGPRTRISNHDSARSYVNWSSEEPFVIAQQILDEVGSVAVNSNLPFCGGLAGYFGYDLARETTPNPGKLTDLAGLPEARLAYYTWALIINHQTRKAWLVFHPACHRELREDVIARLSHSPPGAVTSASTSENRTQEEANFLLTSDFKASISKAEYVDKVEAIKDYISAGDCYQVNFAQHFLASYKGDPWFAYQKLRMALPSPFSAFMSWDDKAILSLSPERFIKLANRQVETRPIKGTAPRGLNVKEDHEKAVALMNSEKDRAENLMIVDLLRNDLGKSCQPGSIRVPKLFDLESYANVHHLVRTVTGTLAEQKTALDLLAGCFPGGSITGAPKKRAMEIIQEMENLKRSIYCGSIGYISACGRMDSNIAIRTLVANAGQLHCWGGGGIVADSNADDEYQESIAKIAILMKTLRN